ncbi:MAG: S8 family serine peptidase [Alphaproteobacteria bacterium]|nr:S8 family serine peptidase [Alphaproteobacteria bacterium]
MIGKSLALALFVSVLLSLPTLAEDNRTGGKTNQGGGVNFGRVVGTFVTQAARLAAQQAIEDAREAEQTPQTTAPTTRKPPVTRVVAPTVLFADVPLPLPRPEFRDVPTPPARPSVFDGRPVILDAQYDPNSLVLILEPRPGVPLDRLIDKEIAERFGLVLIGRRELTLGGIVVARYRLPEGVGVIEMIERLAEVPGLIVAQPQYLFMGAQSAAPPDMKGLQYAPKKLNALVAQETGDGAGIVIGLIDTGVDVEQPAFAHAHIALFDVMADAPVVSRDHGTALAGLMLASESLDGIAPGASLVSVRAFDADETGQALSGSFEIAAAIDVAVAEGARLINLSFAGPRDPLVMTMLDRAAEQGVIIVAAAGNNGPDAPPAWPGAHRDAIAVTATDAGDRLYAEANRGAYVAVSAPGVDVLSPMPEARFDLLSGTSIATAHVSGVIALMLERDPALGRDDILAIFAEVSHDLGPPGRDDQFGIGLADAAAAVAAAMN